MIRNILIPIDLQQESSWLKALPVAIELTCHHRATLHAMTVVPETDFAIPSRHVTQNYAARSEVATRRHLDAFLKERIPSDIPVKIMARHGNICRKILEVANHIDADLIVMASHRPELKDYLLGVNAARVVRHARCSVLVVR